MLKNCRARLSRWVIWAGLAAASWAPVGAQAFCGFYAGKADSSLFNEASQIVLVRDGPRTVLSMLNDYKGDLREFALIVPTPVALQKGQVRIAQRASFDRLDAYSSPRLAEYHDEDPCQFNFDWGVQSYRDSKRMHVLHDPAPAAAVASKEERAKALGVTVEVQYTLGEYDIVSLSAQQSDGLEIWLRENGYRVPNGASAALRPYINLGMKFFVAKVNLQEQVKLGYSMLRPLQFAFESEKFMLPMRLGMLNAPPGKAQDLIIYMLTKQGRVESSNYRTVKLPANMNLPFFVKPKFQDFYKAMFDHEAQKEKHKVVFTEYFWDMSWCDPCAANPLSEQELRNAGVFWVGGDENENFQQMRGLAGINAAQNAINPGASNELAKPANTALNRSLPPSAVGGQGGAQPVVLTRLHVRYTPESFAEDLMFTQTKDRQNWQTRYVIQNPYEGSVAQCSSSMASLQCEALCAPRVKQMRTKSSQRMAKPDFLGDLFTEKGQTEAQLLSSCVQACAANKAQGLQAATQYYAQHLPTRLAQEKQTLVKLTGWTISEVDRLPGAKRFSGQEPPEVHLMPAPLISPTAAPGPTWWQKIFGRP